MQKPTPTDVIRAADAVVARAENRLLLDRHGPDLAAALALAVVDELAHAERLLPAGARVLLGELADRIEAELPGTTARGRNR